MDTPVGLMAGVTFLGIDPAGLLGAGLAFVAGTFIFVSVADLIPELQHRSRSTLVVLSILAGFVGVAGLALLFPG
jgi:zinc transporter ZupT